MGELKTIEMTAKLSNFSVINKDFTRCRCNVFYTGRNRNYSDITKEALQKFINRKGYANVPVVAHLYKGDDGKLRVGGHDSKIILSEEGIEFINECVPFGVIPEDCNPSMDLIIEKSGEQREYFSVDIILWTHRYPIMDAAFSDEIYFNQSMEITLETFYEDDDGYTVIDDFTMSALCLLNKSMNRENNVEPAFESSMVKKFSINEEQFKKNFELMLEELKSYGSDIKSIQNKENYKKEEDTNMDKEKILNALSAVTYENTLNETVSRYGLIDMSETAVGLIDRQDNKVYSVKFAESEDGAIVFDFENAVECSFATREKVEDDFDFAAEIEVAKEGEFSAKVADTIQKEMEKFNAQIDELSKAYEDLKKEYAVAAEKLAQYEAADEQRKAELHEAEIEALYEKFAKKIGRVPEFLCYRADRTNVEKDCETVEAELTVIAGKAAMNKSQAFSYAPTVSGVKEFEEKDALAYTDRYGNLFAKFTK